MAALSTIAPDRPPKRIFMTGNQASIRLCGPSDEAAVYDVCLRTGDNGSDATHLYEDPKALGRIYVGPYLKLEPDLAFVAEDSQGVFGYVLGALDSKRFYDAYVHQWLPEVQRQFPEPTGDPSKWTLTQKIYWQYHHPDVFCPEPFDQYPSHLHIDLLPRAQGKGLGVMMVNRLLGELTAKGSPGVHLGMWITNTRAEGFYRKLGFHELARVGESLYLGRKLT
jgi:ribosomal protein S18 acetylase RimI-like enzyme